MFQLVSDMEDSYHKLFAGQLIRSPRSVSVVNSRPEADAAARLAAEKSHAEQMASLAHAEKEEARS